MQGTRAWIGGMEGWLHIIPSSMSAANRNSIVRPRSTSETHNAGPTPCRSGDQILLGLRKGAGVFKDGSTAALQHWFRHDNLVAFFTADAEPCSGLEGRDGRGWALGGSGVTDLYTWWCSSAAVLGGHGTWSVELAYRVPGTDYSVEPQPSAAASVQ